MDNPETSPKQSDSRQPESGSGLSCADLLAGFDSLRLKEYEDLQRLVNLAGSLNRGSGIVGKITQMESIAESLRRSDMESPRRSFMDFLHLSMVRLNSLANVKGYAAAGVTPESNK